MDGLTDNEHIPHTLSYYDINFQTKMPDDLINHRSIIALTA